MALGQDGRFQKSHTLYEDPDYEPSDPRTVGDVQVSETQVDPEIL